MSVQFLQTPIGVLTLQEKDDCLTRVAFLFGRRHTPKEKFPDWLLGRERDELTSFKANELIQIAEVWNHDEFRSTILLDQAKRQLLEYFDKKRQVFDLPLNPEGTTFRRRVWQGLATIPYGYQNETVDAIVDSLVFIYTCVLLLDLCSIAVDAENTLDDARKRQNALPVTTDSTTTFYSCSLVAFSKSASSKCR